MSRIAIVCALLVLIVAAPASAATKTLDFKLRPWVQQKMTGDPAAAPVVGDMFAYHDGPLFSLAGKRIGTSGATATALEMGTSKMTVSLSSVFKFHGGQILSAGMQVNTIGSNPMNQTVKFSRAITGGTGIYGGARGVDAITVKGGWVYHHVTYETMG